VAQTAAQTLSDRSINSATGVALVRLRTISAIAVADDGKRCRLSSGAAKYWRADANVRSMPSSRYLGANLGRYSSPDITHVIFIFVRLTP
jgi:hypothetical protein